MKPTQRLEIIHALRGVAALMVVFMHFNNFVQPAAPRLGAWLANGYLGVDVFFIISGFIIYVSTEDPATRNSMSFFVRRFCRVALPAWAALAVAVLIRPPYLKDLLLSALFIPLQNSTPPYYGYSVLIVAWTLSYELFFYAIFAVALRFPAGRRHRGLLAVFLIVVLIALSQNAACCSLDPYRAPLFQTGNAHFPDQLISLTGNPITLEFAVGIFLGWAYVNRHFERIATIGFLLTAPVALFLITHFQYVKGHGLDRGGLLAAVTVLYILCLQTWLDHRTRLNQGSPRRWPGKSVLLLGEISYSMYLIHPSIKSALGKLLSRMAPIHSANVDLLIFALALLCTLVCSALFYRWVENPAQNLGRTLAAHIARRRALITTPPAVARF